MTRADVHAVLGEFAVTPGETLHGFELPPAAPGGPVLLVKRGGGIAGRSGVWWICEKPSGRALGVTCDTKRDLRLMLRLHAKLERATRTRDPADDERLHEGARRGAQMTRPGRGAKARASARANEQRRTEGRTRELRIVLLSTRARASLRCGCTAEAIARYDAGDGDAEVSLCLACLVTLLHADVSEACACIDREKTTIFSVPERAALFGRPEDGR